MDDLTPSMDNVPVFDGHNDFLVRLWRDPAQRDRIWLEHNTEGHLDLPRMRAGGLAGGLFAIFVPPDARLGHKTFAERLRTAAYALTSSHDLALSAAQQVAFAQAGHLMWMARVAPRDFALCTSVRDIRAEIARGRIAGVMHLEGAEAIDPGLDALHLFHALGLRSIGLVWSRPTAFGHGVPFRFPGTPDIGPGLTEAGVRLVRACNALNIMIDLSHLNEKGFDDVARVSEAPLVATHSNAHAICPSPRNLTDRQLAQIAETRGLVGLNLATFFLRPDGRANPETGMDDLLRHVDHLLRHLGEDGVGIGSDFDGCPPPKALADVSRLPHFIQALQDHGYGEALIAKIAARNWIDVLERTLDR